MSAPRMLFVCLGNICRSPAAELICRHLARESNLVLELDSCGTARYHVGEMPDARMRSALAQQGFEYDGHRARQFCSSDFDRFDLIIAQDEHNYQDLLAQARTPAQRAQLHCMSEWFPPEWVARFTAVPDPYYGGPEGFVEVIELLRASCRRLLDEQC